MSYYFRFFHISLTKRSLLIDFYKRLRFRPPPSWLYFMHLLCKWADMNEPVSSRCAGQWAAVRFHRATQEKVAVPRLPLPNRWCGCQDFGTVAAPKWPSRDNKRRPKRRPRGGWSSVETNVPIWHQKASCWSTPFSDCWLLVSQNEIYKFNSDLFVNYLFVFLLIL